MTPELHPVGNGLCRLGVGDRVAWLELADPDRRNAVSIEMALDVERAVAEAVAGTGDEVAHTLVLLAQPPVFCSGGVLDDLINPRAPLSEIYRGFIALQDCPLPTLAVVDGPAVGAGVNFAMVCDTAIAGPGARFDPRFLDVGIHPGGGHLWHLSRAVGARNAAALSLFGGTLDGPGAARAGLVWAAADTADDLARLTLELAERAASRERELLIRTKASLRASEALTDHADAVELERDVQQWSMESPWFKRTIEKLQQRLAAKSGND